MEHLPDDNNKQQDMIQEMMYRKFMGLTERKQLDYLYTAFVEKDHTKLSKKYGPKEISVVVDDDFVIITAPTISDARMIRDNMIMNGMMVLDENVEDLGEEGVQVDYAFEGNVQPICLN